MVNKLIASVLPLLPKKFVWLFSKRYISGETLDDAIKASKKLAGLGIRVTVDHLGEYIRELSQAKDVKAVYLSMIERFEEEGISATYSLKPSSFGLLLNFETCYSHVREIIEKAKQYNSFVRIDMEDSSCVDAEIELYHRLLQEFPSNVGLVVQAYLKRTPGDLKYLAAFHSSNTPVNIRLCKGIYMESPEIAIKDRKAINKQFADSLEFLFEKGIYVGIATHDHDLTDIAEELIGQYGLGESDYEFQMLYGVTPELRTNLVKRGHKMRVYVPFGKEWFGYSTRRLKENPKLAFYIIKALFKHG
ncbi:proline dehydrogenase family protein [Marinilabilia rubra]|uniref:proline dehydrogenase n=1 Tax=Marinilabilia rubra TaxID=2162893 RepID=A0A2U2BDX3_9BACT|nr:proline dehydrogenase family protein [Marinilabilia rubra]PWE01258.1 proline dehydrogenase [Marinilabilia rubra]